MEFSKNCLSPSLLFYQKQQDNTSKISWQILYYDGVKILMKILNSFQDSKNYVIGWQISL